MLSAKPSIARHWGEVKKSLNKQWWTDSGLGKNVGFCLASTLSENCPKRDLHISLSFLNEMCSKTDARTEPQVVSNSWSKMNKKASELEHWSSIPKCQSRVAPLSIMCSDQIWLRQQSSQNPTGKWLFMDVSWGCEEDGWKIWLICAPPLLIFAYGSDVTPIHSPVLWTYIQCIVYICIPSSPQYRLTLPIRNQSTAQLQSW